MGMGRSGRGLYTALVVSGAALVGCGEAIEAEEATAQAAGNSTGRRLFERETFGGNGRVCRTCHLDGSGTISPADAQALYAQDPNGPLFRHDGLDDGNSGVTRILTRATFRISIPLPPNVSLADDPAARSVIVLRGSNSTNNVGLENTLMSDGRDPDLQRQALGAINGHAQNTRAPTAAELDAIAEFQQSRAFFTSDKLYQYFEIGRAPALPQGKTASERRGRRFFEDLPFVMNAEGTAMSLDGICAHCHSGPLLDTNNAFGLFVPGERWSTAGVSQINRIGNPVRTFVFTNPDGSTTNVVSPDPGRALITGNAADADIFKAPTLWGINRTAPYFHDNSALDFDELIDQYELFFAGAPTPVPVARFTQQDRDDLKAFLRLLD